MSRRRALPLLLMLLLAQAGCAAGGLAAIGPLMTAFQAVADRSVERTHPTDLGNAWIVTLETFTQMAIGVEEVDRSGAAWRMRGVGGAVNVIAQLSSVTAKMTKVSIRVEAGQLLADKKTGEEIQNQIASALTRSDGAKRDSLSSRVSRTETPATRQAEIPHVKQEPERKRAVTRSPSETSGRRSVAEQRILTVPESYGVPTIAVSIGATAPLAETEAPPVTHDGSGTERGTDLLTAPLRPATALIPIKTLMVPENNFERPPTEESRP